MSLENSPLSKEIMDEVENIGATQEIATPETSQQDTVVEQKPVENNQDRNWREIRRQNEELKRKAKMQDEMLERLLQQQVQAPSQAKQEEIQIGDEDFIQGSQLKKMRERDREDFKRAAREEAEKLLQQREQSQFMDKLKRQFSDFDDVVNPETLALLEDNDPELASIIADLKDPYKIGLQSYKYIKAQGLVDQAPKARRVKEVEKKIEENKKTVQSPQVFDKRPMAQAFKMSHEEMSKLHEEMMYYANMSGGY